jgi:serine phosphatase RsbU (regulator of sigma subunit)
VITALSLPALLYGFSFLYAGKILNPLHGWTLLALPMLFIIGGQLIRRFGKTEIDARALQPDYLDRLAEKERMKRELEIARRVQLSFLPRQLPKIDGLDLAALCIPANEVGGDYYDFVKLDKNRLGVLIGDVSGKGVSAAFYMTLTKGIIKSSVQENLSPSQVLIRANQLFYENVERGIFVSLIYGVFDLEKRTFTSARAGHNPILLMRRLQQNAVFVSPQGLALGLDHGEVFARNIQEQTLVLNNGDVFVFYTDGFTEAMNGRAEEFGESRLIEVLSNGVDVSSVDTINNLHNAVQIFTNATQQHDDMTMVVVKIL